MNLKRAVLQYRSGESEWTRAALQSVSPQGMFCISPEPVSPDERLECELRIQADRGKTLVLRFKAKVLRVVVDASIPGFGIGLQLNPAYVV